MLVCWLKPRLRCRTVKVVSHCFCFLNVSFLSKSVILHRTVQLSSLKFIAQLNELTLLYFYFIFLL